MTIRVGIIGVGAMGAGLALATAHDGLRATMVAAALIESMSALAIAHRVVPAALSQP